VTASTSVEKFSSEMAIATMSVASSVGASEVGASEVIGASVSVEATSESSPPHETNKPTRARGANNLNIFLLVVMGRRIMV
jgi:hypothetical protein